MSTSHMLLRFLSNIFLNMPLLYDGTLVLKMIAPRQKLLLLKFLMHIFCFSSTCVDMISTLYNLLAYRHVTSDFFKELLLSTLNPRPEDEMNNQPPLQLEPLPLARDLLCTFPTVGTILRVIIDKGNEKNVLQLLNAGRWVKFLNILCEVHTGLWCGVLTHFTKLRYLPNEDPLMLARQR